MAETLRRDILAFMDQVVSDLASAHAEIVKLQGGDPAKYTWPEWSPQANTLRWIPDLRARFIAAMDATDQCDDSDLLDLLDDWVSGDSLLLLRGDMGDTESATEWREKEGRLAPFDVLQVFQDSSDDDHPYRGRTRVPKGETVRDALRAYLEEQKRGARLTAPPRDILSAPTEGEIDHG